MKSNIFDCRFVDNSTDKVFHIQEYGESESQVGDFWTRYFHDGRNGQYTFVDAELVKKDVEVEKDKSDAVDVFKLRFEGKRGWADWFHSLFKRIYED